MSKGYMSFLGGMMFGMSQPHDPNGKKYMDWEKAERICLENPTAKVTAGLVEDWGYTSGTIFKNGKWYDGDGVYDQSNWATPIVDVDGKEVPCWTRKPHEGTKVPDWWGRGEELHQEWE